MQAAKHGATFPKAKAIRQSMTPEHLNDFARYETESHRYDFRQRNNLKQNRGR